jgi:O-acetyl-ADP-ribose deacetylase (regulator of RNase III)
MQDQDLARQCFVIMPFGEKKDDQGQVIDFDKIHNEIIKPAIESLRDDKIFIKCIRCDEVEKAGLIHERMIKYILDAEVAVVDITTLNPNVFYELGVRHALNDRVTVLIRREGTKNPFNITGMNTIEYALEPDEKAEQARTAIRNFVRNGLLSSARDSLVYSVVPNLEVRSGQGSISDCRVYRYPLPLGNIKGKEIWLVTGNLRHVNLNPYLIERPIDIWVSSENINMQMARVFDASISGLVRYLGARKDELGDVMEDTIVDELRAKMRGRQQVNPGMVVSTGSGSLLETHRVRRIFHAASVYGIIGGGYHPIDQVENCVTAALVQADRESEREKTRGENPYTSILFPLLTTGTAAGNLVESAKRQLVAAINFIEARAVVTKLERVCFLAPTRKHLTALTVALAELGVQEGIEQAPATAPVA